MKIKLGFHINFSGRKNLKLISTMKEYENTYKIKVFQIFLSSPRFINSKPHIFTDKELEKLKNLKSKLFVHENYTISFLNNFDINSKFLFKRLENISEINKKTNNKIEGVIIHLPKSVQNTKKEDWKTFVKNLKKILKFIHKNKYNVCLCLENVAVKTKPLITDLAFDMGKLLDEIKEKYYKYLGFCIDTAHLFASGMLDFRNIKETKKYVRRLNNLSDFIKIIHLNDNEAEFGSGIDKHASICEGKIGNVEGIKYFIESYKKIPFVLERPKFKDIENITEIINIRELLSS